MKVSRQALAIKRDMDGITAHLIERGLGDDANFSIVERSGDMTDVTFLGAEHISIAMGDIDYSDLYRELSARRSYSFKLLDGGLVQITYRFRSEQLVQHRLGILSFTQLAKFSGRPGFYMRDELFVDIISRQIVPFPIRFDFDGRDGVFKDVLHPKSHLTLGDMKGCRVPVTSPLTPRWFIEFVLRYFYQTEKYDFVDRLPRHSCKFQATISNAERQVSHIFVPSEL